MNELEKRIKRLEDALIIAGKPCTDFTCQCCGELYVPQFFDSVRCSVCCSTCYWEKGKWVKGKQCPVINKERGN